MIIARTHDALARALHEFALAGRQVALVPTMGALHDGHLSLIAIARAAIGSGAVAASIFVNPLQFGASEDLSRYPRDEAGDLAALSKAGCDLVWLPDVQTMYPAGERVMRGRGIFAVSPPWWPSCLARSGRFARCLARRISSNCR
jgi:pantoate--beta-alanine ligase